MSTKLTSPVAASSLRERIVMPVDCLVANHNWIPRPAAVPAVAPTAGFGHAYADADQAAPPRGNPR